MPTPAPRTETVPTALATSEVKLADMWSVSGQLLHTPAYRRAHAALLATALGRHNLSILDAACGTGFPMIELHELGYNSYVTIEREIDGPQQLTDILESRTYLQNIIDEIYGEEASC